MHSSWLVWTTINNLTDRSRNPHCPCPITANSIALQFVKNGTYKTKDRESDRLVNKEVSDLWRIPTPENKCISGEFTSENLPLLSSNQNQGKSQVLTPYDRSTSWMPAVPWSPGYTNFYPHASNILKCPSKQIEKAFKVKIRTA